MLGCRQYLKDAAKSDAGDLDSAHFYEILDELVSLYKAECSLSELNISEFESFIITNAPGGWKDRILAQNLGKWFGFLPTYKKEGGIKTRPVAQSPYIKELDEENFHSNMDRLIEAKWSEGLKGSPIGGPKASPVFTGKLYHSGKSDKSPKPSNIGKINKWDDLQDVIGVINNHVLAQVATGQTVEIHTPSYMYAICLLQKNPELYSIVNRNLQEGYAYSLEQIRQMQVKRVAMRRGINTAQQRMVVVDSSNEHKEELLPKWENKWAGSSQIKNEGSSAKSTYIDLEKGTFNVHYAGEGLGTATSSTTLSSAYDGPLPVFEVNDPFTPETIPDEKKEPDPIISMFNDDQPEDEEYDEDDGDGDYELDVDEDREEEMNEEDRSFFDTEDKEEEF